MSNTAPESLKIVLVGDDSVGKTSLMSEYVRPGASTGEEWMPTVFDNLSLHQSVNGLNYSLSLWDTAGHEDYDRLRPLSYPATNFFIVCFAIDNHRSFQRVVEKFVPELDFQCPGTPKILVGTKCDLRDNEDFVRHMKKEGKEFINQDDALNVASTYGFKDYVETSSFLHVNVDEVFLKLIGYHSENQKPNKSKDSCLVM